jgi:hypothetical protein
VHQQLPAACTVALLCNEIGKSFRCQCLCRERCKERYDIASGAPNPLAHYDMKMPGHCSSIALVDAGNLAALL